MLQGVCLLAGILLWQDLPPISSATDFAHLRDGVNPPKLLHASNPEMTPQAVAAGIEGTLVLQAVIDNNGNVAYASVLSPLPAGLDVKALAAVKHWRFTPGVMDGEVIPVLTTIDVVFRLPYKPPDPQTAQRQSALHEIETGAAPSPQDVAELKNLAKQGMTPAIGLLGEWLVNGTGVPKNVSEGIAYVRRAADSNDARALFFLGNAELSGGLIARNQTDGWKLMQRAAFFGNSEAQMALSDKYEREKNWNAAKWYLRLCAATAHSNCEYRLGKLMVNSPDLNPNDFAQGVSWLELAKEHGNKEAEVLWSTSVAKLSDIQLGWIAQLKPHLELKHYHGF